MPQAACCSIERYPSLCGIGHECVVTREGPRFRSEGGRIAERGTLEELLAANGRYARLVTGGDATRRLLSAG
jgi:hypothetical protein